MSVEEQHPWEAYLGDGITTAFPYPWEVPAADEIEVYVQHLLTTAYTLTNLGVLTGGLVIFFQPPLAGETIFLRRRTPLTQLTTYIPNGPFDAKAHENALDKLTMMIQDLYERVGRSPAFAVDAVNAMRDLLFPTGVPLKLIGWDATGTVLTLYDSAIQTVTVNTSTGETHGVTTVTVPSVGGATFLTAAAFLQPGIELAGVGYRVITAFSTENALASIDLGGLGVENRWGQALGLSVNSVNNAGQWVGGRATISTAQDVVLVANPGGAHFGVTGAARLTAFWTTYTPL